MNIEYKEYILIPADVAPDRFDLFRRKVVEKGKTKGKVRHEIIGYGYKIASAINSIIYEELNKNQTTVQLKDFLSEWEKESEIVINHFKNVNPR